MNEGSGLSHLDKNLLQVKNHELLHWVAMLAFRYPLHVKMYVKLSKVGVLMIGSHLFTGNIKSQIVYRVKCCYMGLKLTFWPLPVRIN